MYINNKKNHNNLYSNLNDCLLLFNTKKHLTIIADSNNILPNRKTNLRTEMFFLL